VRAHLYFGGWIFELLSENQTKATYFACVIIYKLKKILSWCKKLFLMYIFLYKKKKFLIKKADAKGYIPRFIMDRVNRRLG